jgi:phage gp36-like protein
MYGTATEFSEAFGENETVMLTNLDTPMATAINPVPLSRALTDAAALIDSYIGRRYLLPLSVTPQVLIPYALDIARYRLDRIRDREDVRKRYEDAIKWLEMVAKGTLDLGTDVLLNTPVVAAGTGDGAVDYGSVYYGDNRPSINLDGFL